MWRFFSPTQRTHPTHQEEGSAGDAPMRRAAVPASRLRGAAAPLRREMGAPLPSRRRVAIGGLAPVHGMVPIRLSNKRRDRRRAAGDAQTTATSACLTRNTKCAEPGLSHDTGSAHRLQSAESMTRSEVVCAIYGVSVRLKRTQCSDFLLRPKVSHAVNRA